MKIPFLSSILVTIIFGDDPRQNDGQKLLSWTIPTESATPTQNVLRSRETASWINPEPNSIANEIFTIGDVVYVQWTTDFDEYSIYLWQQDLEEQFSTADQDPIYTKESDDTETGGFNWTASTGDFSLSKSNVFFFSLGQNATLTGVFTDHYFNLTEAKTISTTSSVTSTISSTATSSTSATITSAASTTSTSSATPTSSSLSLVKDSSSTSSPIKLGIGIGLGLGIPLILCLAALVYLKWRQGRNGEKQSIPSPTPGGDNSAQEMHLMDGSWNGNGGPVPVPSSFYDKAWGAGMSEGNNIAEMPEHRGISELPAETRSELP